MEFERVCEGASFLRKFCRARITVAHKSKNGIILFCVDKRVSRMKQFKRD